MHPNPAFRHESDARALAAARERGFGVLTIAPEGRVLAAHIPFVLHEDRVEAHLVRSNPVARALRGGGADALLAVTGPDGYISPDWYGETDRVPTWNYVAVHLRGRLSLLPQDALRGHLDRLSAHFEARLAPKPPWTADKMTPEVLDGLMRQIVPVELIGLSIESTFKLNQNRTVPARRAAADALESSAGAGTEKPGLARMMREVDA